MKSNEQTQKLSSWAVTAYDNAPQGEPLFAGRLWDDDFEIRRVTDSVWLLWGKSQSPLGVRIMYGFGGELTDVSIEEADGQLTLSATSAAGSFSSEISFSQDVAAILSFRTRFTPAREMLIPFTPRDLLVFPSGKSEPEGEVFCTQTGNRTANVFFSVRKPFRASFFYLQDLGELNDFFQDAEASGGDCVGGDFPELGFRLPTMEKKPLQSGREYTVSKGHLAFLTDVPKDATGVSVSYLDSLAQIYPLIRRPDTSYHDWPAIASRGLRDVKNNKGCWAQSGGHAYLNAYLTDYDTPPEIMVQLAVLIPLTEYFEWKQDSDEVLEELLQGLPAFYDEKLQCLDRWLPSLKHRLDQSEEQKKERVMDSWYLHHPLMNLSRLALRKNKVAKKLLLDSVDYAIKVAQHFNYEWPVFYKMDTLEVLKAETQPGKGGEKDVPGAYAHLMLQLWDLTGEEKYLDEAKKATEKLLGKGFEIFYQANNTAFSAATMLRLYKITGDSKYMDLSYVCLSGLFLNMQIWDESYGFSRSYCRFFGIYPLSDAPYTAPYEELEVYAALTYYLRESQDVTLKPSVRMLISEFVRYFVYRMPAYFPANLPEEAISPEVKTGEIDSKVLVPLEDLRDGWELNGQVGQEVYGSAGAGFGIVPRQYFRCRDTGIMLFSDYPVHKFRCTAESATFELDGSPGMICKVRLIHPSGEYEKIELTDRDSKDTFEYTDASADYAEFEVRGGTKLKVTWKKAN